MRKIGTEKSFKWNGKEIYYSDMGNGIPVILIHGYLESRQIWNGFAREMSRQVRVICPDLPGHGASDVFYEVHTMDFLADTVHAVLHHTGIQKAYMVGHSLGGYVTLAFLDHYPERLLGFSLFHSHPLPDSEEIILNRKKEIKLINAGRKDLIYKVNIPNAFARENLERCRTEIEEAKRIAAKTPDRGVIAMLRGMIDRPDRRQNLENTSLPFLWILGRNDNYIDHSEIQKHVILPGSGQLITLDHSGHQGFIEEPENSVLALLHFVK